MHFGRGSNLLQIYGKFEEFPLVIVHEVWVGVIFLTPDRATRRRICGHKYFEFSALVTCQKITVISLINLRQSTFVETILKVFFCVKGSLDATHIFLVGSKLIDVNALGLFLRDLPAKIVHCLGWCHVMTHVKISMLKGKI